MIGSLEPVRRSAYIGVVTLFILCGTLIGASAYVSFIAPETRQALKLGMVFLSLVAWMAFGLRDNWRQYRPLALSFLAVSVGVLLAAYFGNVPMRLAGATLRRVDGVALAKFGESLPIILSILVVHFVSGGNWAGLFLGWGRWKVWLPIGLAGFTLFFGVAALQTFGSELSWDTVASALPWILLFIFANAFMEELWFRGLFLKKLQPFVGERTALVITSLVFAFVHISATYVIDILVFMVALLALALLWGWLMQRSNSIWGAVLIHAGADILVVIGFLAGAGL